MPDLRVQNSASMFGWGNGCRMRCTSLLQSAEPCEADTLSVSTGRWRSEMGALIQVSGLNYSTPPKNACHTNGVPTPLLRLPDMLHVNNQSDHSPAVSLFGNTISHHVIKLIEQTSLSEDGGGG